MAALVAAALDPCEALVLFAAEHGIPAEYMRSARGWPEVDWSAAQQRLADRGLVNR